LSETVLSTAIGVDTHTDVISTSETYRCTFDYQVQSASKTAAELYLRLGYDSGGSNPMRIGEVWFGRSALEEGGNRYDFAETPTQIYFDGSASVDVSADTLSDVFTYNYIPGYTYIISVHIISDASNEVHHKSADVTGYLSYKKAGNVAADVTWSGGPDTTYDKKGYIFENAFENDALTLEKNIFNLELEATTPPSVVSTLPDLQITASIATRMYTEMPLYLPVVQIEAEFSDRAELEEYLSALELEASMGAITEVDLYLPDLGISATGLAGSLATLDEVLGFLRLAGRFGYAVQGSLPVTTLDISMIVPMDMEVDAKIPAFLFEAAGGRERFLSLDRHLPPMELSATGGMASRLDADFFHLELVAHIGRAGVVDADLFMLELLATAGGPTALIEDMPGLHIWALATHKQNELSGALPVLQFEASISTEAILDATLPIVQILASATHKQNNLDKKLPWLQVEAAASAAISTVADIHLWTFRIEASMYTGQAWLEESLSWLRLDATAISGFGATLDRILPSPDLDASMLLTPFMELDAEIGPPYMGAEPSGSEDPVLPGGVIEDITRWSTIVLRHSRW